MATFVLVVPQLRTIPGQDRFTYATTLPLQPGELVRVPWRKQIVPGVVVAIDVAAHPKAKLITETTGVVLPHRYVAFLHWLATQYQISEPAALLAALPDDVRH